MCEGSYPKWFPDLVKLARELDLPGFQISYSDGHGGKYDCAVGWASLFPFPTRLTIEDKMRYASLSKIFTSVVVTQLGAEGLRLDARVAQLLIPGVFPDDPRVADVTVEQLMHHTAGFDRRITPDPMMTRNPWCPKNLESLARQRLDHTPGEVYAYSNLGYCLLGEILVRHQRVSLDEIFLRRLFAKVGVSDRIVPLRRHQILPDEPEYFFDERESLSDLLRLDFGSMLATGGWAGTAKDLHNLLKRMFGPEADLLTPEMRSSLLAAPTECDARRWRTCHGKGFYKFQQPGRGAMYWRDGSLPGVTSFAGITEAGATLVLLANGRRHMWIPDNDRLGRALYQWMQERSD